MGLMRQGENHLALLRLKKAAQIDSADKLVAKNIRKTLRILQKLQASWQPRMASGNSFGYGIHFPKVSFRSLPSSRAGGRRSNGSAARSGKARTVDVDRSQLPDNSVGDSNTMSQPYEEFLDGATMPRTAPGERHEQICRRLHRQMAMSVNGLASTQLLAPRTQVQVSRTTLLRPDLALVTAASGKLFLAVEIVSRDDHRADTVTKKDVYDQIRVPRLWMVDPRYDNVEIYHSFEFGLKLHGILAVAEVLSERLIPQFKLVVAELFASV